MKPSERSSHVALITGASTGIGALYADRLALRGYDLVLVARNRERLVSVATDIIARTGRRVELIVADLTSRKELLEIEQRLASDESIRMLVNNAGVSVGTPVSASDPDALEAMIQLNVVALTRLARAAAPAFVERGGGTIINLASVVALVPTILNGTYSGTKAYVVNFTQALHHELGGQGLRMQAVLPGATRTDFWDVSGVPISNVPAESVMEAQDMVDASLAGLDLGELITSPSLPDVGDWQNFDLAREALAPKLSRNRPADRYAAPTDRPARNGHPG